MEEEIKRLQDSLKQAYSEIKILKDNAYDQGVQIKVLEDQWKEYHTDMELLRHQLKLLDVGQKWFKKSKVEHKEKVQGNLKGLSTK